CSQTRETSSAGRGRPSTTRSFATTGLRLPVRQSVAGRRSATVDADRQLPLHAYEVGALYNPARTSWPEAVQYNYRPGSPALLLFWRQPGAREVRAVKSGTASFALTTVGPVLFLLYRFGDMAWSDQPFSIHLVPEGERGVPPPTGTSEAHAVLTVILVDAA